MQPYQQPEYQAIIQSCIKADLKTNLMAYEGDAQFQQAQFQQVLLQLPNQHQQQQFYLDEQQQFAHNQPTIKTMQFNTSLHQPSHIPKIQSSLQMLSLSTSDTLALGFNSLGNDTIIIIQGRICQAIGCCILLDGITYMKHSHQICLLKYYHHQNILLSGSQGLRPQIIIWQCQQSNHKLTLNLTTKSHQPKKSISVAHCLMFGNLMLSVDKIGVHRSCCGYLFDLQTGKRIGGTIKLEQKVFGIQLISKPTDQHYSIAIVTNESVLLLSISKQPPTQSSIAIKKYVQGNNYTAVAHLSTSNNLVLANKLGEVEVLGNLEIVKKSIHKGWISTIKTYNHQKQQIMLSVGVQDCSLAIMKIHNKQILILQKLQFHIYIKSLTFDPTTQIMLLGFRDASYQSMTMSFDANDKLTINKIKQKCFTKPYILPQIQNQYKQKVVYNRHSQQMIFYSNHSKNVLMLNIFKQNQFIYHLKQYPLCLDSTANFVVYGFIQSNNHKASNILKNSTRQKTESINKKQLGTVILCENFLDKQLVERVEFNNQIISEIKLNSDGTKLCAGTDDGNIIIISLLKDQKNKRQLCQCSSTDKHSSKILEIFWDKKDSCIRTISLGQVFYWEIKNDTFKLIKVKCKKVADAEWPQDSKLPLYSWLSKGAWQQMGFIEDIKSIVACSISQNRYVCVGMYDGTLRIYNYPCKKQIFKQYKIFNDNLELFGWQNILGAFKNGGIILWKLESN